ncbi:MAG TPA: cytochrome C oxidase subunit IV family protein [Phenylobacterium sp.]|uniref:cytochrome C oxidase subunit IV family protein n=1 Tax=Phenylobacterium sp. TaxID=1871053 RepID=UPI002B47573E|nr:cytochrome C oxidase subunit IV family protein [Phenylobacterium sp.]HKR89639.1 cytochrome C oxidase subunit IV family protein [Phenylobacterium sp.]
MAADIDNVGERIARKAAEPVPQPAPLHETSPATVSKTAHVQGQQHPIKIYLQVWGYLFVLSTMSYLVDYFHVEGALRSVLIVTFMFLKAGLIVSIFMHMAWERLALVYAILVPPLCLGTLVLLMAIESDYTFWTRIIFFGKGP